MKGLAENQKQLWSWFKQGFITEKEFRRQQNMLEWIEKQKRTTIEGKW